MKLDTEQLLNQASPLSQFSRSLSSTVHNLVLENGEPTRRIADLLHGTWLGHPLHPVLTDATIGGWTLGGLLDVISLVTGSPSAEVAADWATGLGTAAAIPTAVAGLADFSTIFEGASTTAGTHGLINLVSTGLYLLSVSSRRSGRRGLGVALSMIGMGLITGSAWLGGELVYKYKVGVSHAKEVSNPKNWTAVLDETQLVANQPRRVQVQGSPVLLYRTDGAVYAISAVCSHEGGPLDQGKIEGHCVECPWHQSVFDLKDGSVVHGPATYVVQGYETRIQDGQVEVRIPEQSNAF